MMKVKYNKFKSTFINKKFAEEFLLVKKRKLNIFTKEESPTKEELLERTKHLPTLNPSPPFVKITEFLNQDDVYNMVLKNYF